MESQETPPKLLMVLCPTCLEAGRQPAPVVIKASATSLRCEHCHRHHGLLTRYVKQAYARPFGDRGQAILYQITTVEVGGRSRPREFQLPVGPQIVAGGWYTFVFRGKSLVGFSHQSADPMPVWQSVRQTVPSGAQRKSGKHALLWKFLTGICSILVVLYAFRVGRACYRLALAHPQAIGLWALMATLTLSPLLWWLLRTLREEDEDAFI